MTPLELRLPNLTEGEPEAQLRQLRSYLYQLDGAAAAGSGQPGRGRSHTGYPKAAP